MDTIRTVTAYSLESHGIQHPQYWQGAGVAYTSWRECYTGTGPTEGEAADDALDVALSVETIDAALVSRMGAEASVMGDTEVCCECEYEDERDSADGRDECVDECELAYYVTLYVR